MPTGTPHIEITEIGPQKFSLKIRFEGRDFDCGTYLNRAAAMQAGKLFAERKEGEREGRKKRPRAKK